MERSKLKLKKIPDTPGVYFFLGKKKEILYIGKATSLRTRISSYFDGAISEKRSVAIAKMVFEAKQVDWSETDSVLEALLLETNLIRTHKPVYNTRSKDDKSYNHVVITDEEFPRVLIVRGKDLIAEENSQKYLYIFGPFPQGSLFKEAMKLIRKLFQFYDTQSPSHTHKSKMSKGKLNFNTQIGLYPESVTKEAYAETIRHIALFFEGRKREIITELEKQMHAYAKKEAFEEAQRIKKKIFALEHIQDIALIKNEARQYSDDRGMRFEAYDVAHLGGSHMVGVMTVSYGDRIDTSEYRKFKVQGISKANDTGALTQILRRRFAHTEWQKPACLIVDGSTAQKNTAERVLREYKLVIPVVGVVKDEKHRPKRIIGAPDIIQKYRTLILELNAEAHRFALSFHKVRRSRSLTK